MSKLWQKSPAQQPHPLLEAFTVGEDPRLDLRILPFDILASRAHAEGLRSIGILSKEELSLLLHALTALEKDVKKGRVTITPEDEDCHTVIENFLTKELGPLGGKIHTGRSRNDQVLTALRLFMQERLAVIRTAALGLAQAFLARAKKHENVPFPGYSHTQQAMLSSLGHYYGSFVEALLEDCELLDAIAGHVDRNPLGSAAGFGVALPLDREGTTEKLGFRKLQWNSLSCQASRGKYESAYLEGLGQLMLTLGRFATDMLFFTARECDYFSVPDALVTGSSIMPQKRNLDGLEILRGYVSVVTGNQHAIQGISSKLLSGYNRDLQLLKKPVIESSDIVLQSLQVAKLYVEGCVPKKERIAASITPGIFLADVATALAKEKNIPFREAYRQAEKEQKGVPDFAANLRSKVSPGAPGNLDLGRYRRMIASMKARPSGSSATS
ncbi:MAG: argininosuccinate lyase [Candidatus Peribacteraceae bacterium]